MRIRTTTAGGSCSVPIGCCTRSSGTGTTRRTLRTARTTCAARSSASNPDGSIPADNPGGHKWWAYGIRNSFGFAFDPQTGSLWETENGPECNDELNLIVRGGNYAWGPNETCAGSAPGNTNQDGKNRRLPEDWWTTTIGITGAAFCDGCSLGAAAEGDLFLGACCDGGVIQQLELNAGRDGVMSRTDVGTAPGGAIYSMEVGPNGSIYFSDYEAIYRVT